MQKLDDVEFQIIDEVATFVHDPLGFVLFSFPWGSSELEEFKGPQLWQAEILEEVGQLLKQQIIDTSDAVNYVVNEAAASGHGVGKSALVAWIILWAMSTFEDTRGVVTANTESQLRTKTWPELAKWHRLFIAKDWFTVTATSIYSNAAEHEKTWRIDMIPWSKERTEAFAGLHNKGKRIVIIFDEASAIDDVIWEVTEGALTDEKTEILWFVFGNPTRNVGRFHSCFNTLRHRWHHRQIDSRNVPITNKKQIKQWIEDYGEDSDFVRVRVKGTFPRMSDHQFIATDVAESARGRYLTSDQYDFAAVILGVDRAWSGDTTQIWLRQGLMSKRLAKFEKGEDDMIVAGHLSRFCDEYKADAVFIDFGYGTGIWSAGNQMGRKNWRLVEFGGKPNDKRYLNKRMEMWALMKDWLIGGGSIPDEQEIYNDLVAPEAYEIQVGPNTGRMKLESKDEMKERGLPSPDAGDALALTFAFPVLNKSQRQFMKVTQQSYDPLNLKRHEPQKYNPLSGAAIIH